MYREFRDRFHGGRSPQYGLTLVPLASKYLTAASNLCSAEKLENFQVLIDIMENLCPGLATMPYETEQKKPNAKALEQVTRLTKLSLNDNAGTIYSEKVQYDIDSYKGKITPFSLFYDEFETYAESYNGGLLSKSYVKDKLESIKELKALGKFSHATKILPYSHILMHKFFD